MRKINQNAILVVFAALFICTGIWGESLTDCGKGAWDLLRAVKHLDLSGWMDAEKKIEKSSNEKLNYHDRLIDVDSLRSNLLGTRVVIKNGSVAAVKCDDEMLCIEVGCKSDTNIQETVAKIKELETVAEENGARFLYCAAPRKEEFATLPENAVNHSTDNHNRLIDELRASQVPTLDLTSMIKESGVPVTEAFYYTDHHWRVKTGFSATEAICARLEELYDFQYDRTYTDLDNYQMTHYPDWFLGSRGKKAGTYFTWQGADDFDLITPKFETSFTAEQPLKGEKREGAFEETLLYMEKLEKDYYKSDPYATYSGGNYRLQIMKNERNPDGKKILMVRDSFACVVAPFLALQTGELHTCDMRDNMDSAVDKVNLKEYIEEIHPDYVIILFSATPETGETGKYDFFPNLDME